MIDLKPTNLKMHYVAPIEINNLHDILYYAFDYFKFKTHDTFLNFFEDNQYHIKHFEEEDIEKQKIVFKKYTLSTNLEYLIKNGFIEENQGITNKGIKALMKMNLIQYSQDFNKEAKKWIALLDE